MRVGAILAAIPFTACAQVAAQEPSDPIHLGDTSKWGRLERIVKPDYPYDAVKRRQSGVVDVSGVVQANGLLTDVTFTPDRPESSIFVAALQDSVPSGWLFTPTLGNDCVPVPTRVGTRVSFEIDGGEPRVFVTHAKRESAAPPKRKPHYNPVSRKKMEYPMGMWKIGWIATVYARIQVEGDGRVSEVRAKPFSRPSRDEVALAPFTRMVEETLKEWQFPPAPEGEKAPWIGCYTVQFNLTN